MSRQATSDKPNIIAPHVPAIRSRDDAMRLNKGRSMADSVWWDDACSLSSRQEGWAKRKHSRCEDYRERSSLESFPNTAPWL